MNFTILFDESQNIFDCKEGYVTLLMIDEWWLFYKDKELKQIGIFETLENVIEYINL